MRHTYSLSEETIKVLKGREAAIADEMNVSDRYVYAILAESETDPFAKFLGIFAAAVRDGAPVRHWMDKLEAVIAREERRTHMEVRMEAAKFVKRTADVSAVTLTNGDDAQAVLRSARTAIAQGKRLEQAALEQLELITDDGPFRGKPVNTQVREVVKAAMNGGRSAK